MYAASNECWYSFLNSCNIYLSMKSHYSTITGPNGRRIPLFCIVLFAAASFPFLLPSNAWLGVGIAIHASEQASNSSVDRLSVSGSHRKPGLNKDYIDTMVLHGLVLLSDANGAGSAEFSRREGIEEAKRIATRLRVEAKGESERALCPLESGGAGRADRAGGKKILCCREWLRGKQLSAN